jgi:hypothetical protein
MKTFFLIHSGELSVYEAVRNLVADDVCRLAVLDPMSAKTLLQSDNRPFISERWPLIEELSVLPRTTASRIPPDSAGKSFFDIRNLVKIHHMRTMKLKRTTDEEAEFEWLHRDAAEWVSNVYIEFFLLSISPGASSKQRAPQPPVPRLHHLSTTRKWFSARQKWENWSSSPLPRKPPNSTRYVRA